MKTLHFKKGKWHGVLAEKGANLLRLQYDRFNILRTPRTLKEFELQPEIWGMPLLFLPNRTGDGRFSWRGEDYCFPVNEKLFNNHIHGFLHLENWKMQKQPDGFSGVIQIKDHPWWQHNFDAEVNYSFGEAQLCQKVTFRNTGSRAMPLLFGEHSAFRLPLGSSVRVTAAKRRLELSSRFLPTGKFLPLENNTFDNSSGAVSIHTENVPDEDGFSGAVISHPSAGLKVIYQVDEKFRYWMLWNYRGRRRMFCPEPQSCSINAVNAAALLEDPGVIALEPEESISFISSIKVAGS